MNKGRKILITVGITILFIFIMSILNIKYDNGSQLRTILGCSILYVIIRAIWKIPFKKNISSNLSIDKIN
ncbi:hypothetical protein BW723_12810 [Polaribacter reichenbachii]|uniref:Uncharacterized protein n=1 Tax=Polaribacter reichenbachii TaxID=996801 RepID=A0A1B8U052_9FLAO|nr:hypothetical protein BW723_12810 [Polaribacter reichenbachii]AUC17750.1 hypothetical protein BTO17_03260 [Polaribacter reichenbachii]OBY65227.1 hypothetical protein LPB301_08965 [Polaribacter reichenbachii]